MVNTRRRFRFAEVLLGLLAVHHACKFRQGPQESGGVREDVARTRDVESEASPVQTDMRAADSDPCMQDGLGEAFVIAERTLAELTGRPQPAAVEASAVRTNVAGRDGVVFRLRRPNAFTPTKTELVAFETGIRQHLLQMEPPMPVRTRCLDRYARHYAGQREQGRRIIYVMFLCDRPSGWERRTFSGFTDGGDCYFGARFDVAAGRYVVEGESTTWQSQPRGTR